MPDRRYQCYGIWPLFSYRNSVCKSCDYREPCRAEYNDKDSFIDKPRGMAMYPDVVVIVEETPNGLLCFATALNYKPCNCGYEDYCDQMYEELLIGSSEPIREVPSVVFILWEKDSNSLSCFGDLVQGFMSQCNDCRYIDDCVRGMRNSIDPVTGRKRYKDAVAILEEK